MAQRQQPRGRFERRVDDAVTALSRPHHDVEDTGFV
jgi:hypothetical protein